ncbi:DNA polymerase III subunit gamma/tau [Candidatus Epulonipiscium viviparus]|uniref:DNA polymerase III subunit gamma/tau n=1 Tax=Candidatus Epulonipiscium viviparus TaxID=420336 RepID=UPI00016C0C4B|nr:DNA polymerase III subunit gamma/tau [Candidatus Epulopiscium viviparus]
MYLTLYRKYRPQKFSDMVGQEHITKTLKNQIKLNRIAHAYLFTGSRGTGKTTAAKIFARAINCKNSVDGKPCEKCVVCKEIAEGAFVNIIELDAASHNGVDDIRQINEEVLYTPAVGVYKVYIIDEVHMLSPAAFNAMLKTLEEPPPYVVFILATTDPQKIPATVLSRCQRFDFRRISTSDICDCLLDYMQRENIEIEKEAVELIARLADGGMRDALSILEQCISFYIDEKITHSKVLKLVGAVDNALLFEMMNAVIEMDAAKAIAVCNEINQQGRNIKQFAKDLLMHTRNLLIAKTTEQKTEILDYTQEHVRELTQQANELAIETIFRYIKNFTELDMEMKTSTFPRITLEVAVIKLCTPEVDLSKDSVLDRMLSIEKQLEEVKKNGIKVVEKASEEAVVTEIERVKATSEEYQTFLPIWEKVLAKLWSLTRSLFEAGTLEMYVEHDVIQIVDRSSQNNAANKRSTLAEGVLKEIRDKIIEVTGKEYTIRAIDEVIYSQNSAAEILSMIGNRVNYSITAVK